MRNFNTITLFALCIISLQLIAENKDFVELSNEYTNNVAVNLVWKNKSFPYNLLYQDALIPIKTHNQIIKSPTSGYRLFSIDVAPVEKAWNDTASLIGNGLFIAGTTVAAGTVGVTSGAIGGVLSAAAAGGNSQVGMASGLVIGASAAGATAILISGASKGISKMGSAINHSTNFKKVHSHGNRYFIIEPISTNNNKINLRCYKSRNHYEDEIIKRHTA